MDREDCERRWGLAIMLGQRKVGNNLSPFDARQQAAKALDQLPGLFRTDEVPLCP